LPDPATFAAAESFAANPAAANAAPPRNDLRDTLISISLLSIYVH
jgi:hypothetical protein